MSWWIYLINFFIVLVGSILTAVAITTMVFLIITFMANRIAQTYDETGKEP